jgi:hypothetical protein
MPRNVDISHTRGHTESGSPGPTYMAHADRHGSRRGGIRSRTALLDEGPPPLSAEELEDHRYGLSALLDDLTGADDADEIAFIAVPVFNATALLAITLHGRWLGTGKWLGRQLRAADPQLHRDLMAAFRQAVTGDEAALAGVAERVLDRAGGRLTEGYRRDKLFTS